MAKQTKTKQTKTEYTSMWYIYSKSRSSIWRRTFLSYEECRHEFQKQMSALTDDQIKKVDWEIVKCGTKVNRVDTENVDFGAFN